MALITFDYDAILSAVATVLRNSSALSYVPDSSIHYLVGPEYVFAGRYWPGLAIVPGGTRFTLEGLDGAGQKAQEGTLTVWAVTRVPTYDQPQAPLAGYSAGSGATLDEQKGALDILKDVESALDETTLSANVATCFAESVTEARTLRMADDDDLGVWGVTMGLGYRFYVTH